VLEQSCSSAVKGAAVLSAAIILALGLYLALSVVNQCAIIFGNTLGPYAVQKWLMRFRVYCRTRCFYLPIWTFFSRVPDANVTLLIRDRLLDGSLTPWRAVQHVYHPAIRFLWNPDRRREKAILELSVSLVGRLGKQIGVSDESILSSQSYQSLLRYCLWLSPSPITHSRQFMIFKDYFANELWRWEVAFISPESAVARSVQCS
jgi:hypothetical protein